jgi:hypothetical protein
MTLFMEENRDNAVTSMIDSIKIILCVVLGNKVHIHNEIFANSFLSLETIQVILDNFSTTFRIFVMILKDDKKFLFQKTMNDRCPLLVLLQNANSFSLLHHRVVNEFDSGEEIKANLCKEPFIYVSDGKNAVYEPYTPLISNLIKKKTVRHWNLLFQRLKKMKEMSKKLKVLLNRKGRK